MGLPVFGLSLGGCHGGFFFLAVLVSVVEWHSGAIQVSLDRFS